MTRPTPNPPHTPPSDPPLEALLDEALGPLTAPPTLHQRVLQNTTPQITARRPPVLGSIGSRHRPTVAAAAAVVIAATLGLAVYHLLPTTDTPTPDQGPTALARIGQVDREMAEAMAATDDALSYQIELTEMQLALVETRPPLDDPQWLLDTTLLETELDLLETDLATLF